MGCRLIVLKCLKAALNLDVVMGHGLLGSSQNDLLQILQLLNVTKNRGRLSRSQC